MCFDAKVHNLKQNIEKGLSENGRSLIFIESGTRPDADGKNKDAETRQRKITNNTIQK